MTRLASYLRRRRLDPRDPDHVEPDPPEWIDCRAALPTGGVCRNDAELNGEHDAYICDACGAQWDVGDILDEIEQEALDSAAADKAEDARDDAEWRTRY